MGQKYDLQGSAPTLIDQGVKDLASINAFNQSIVNARTRRNCTGVSDNGLVLFFSIANVTLHDMAAEGLYQKVKFMQNNDGGGSQSLHMGGAYVITTDGRSIPACVGLEV
jgi:hypothetical protein